jgi:hypothetical protein
VNSSRSGFSARHLFLLVLAGLFGAAACQPVKQPKGPEREYLDATDLFKRGNFDRALDYSEGVADASPPNAYTDRARVFRIVIYGSRVKAYKELGEAYGEGAKKTKKAHFKAEYQHLQNDAFQLAATAALGMAETAHQMMGGEGIGKEVVLETPYPSTEGPVKVAQLERVKDGDWIEPADQDAASLAAREKGIDDELAQLVGEDRAKVRAELTAGPVKIAGVDYSLFLAQELLNAATTFDHKHFNDYSKLKVVAQEADDAAQAALNMLKDNPDKNKEKTAKKIQADIKDLLKKNMYAT